MANVEPKYKISLIDSAEIVMRRYGKFNDLIDQLRPKLNSIPTGKSLKIEYQSSKDATAFGASMKAFVKKNNLSNIVIGVSSTQKCVFIGRNTNGDR